jgi:quercetin dioxygenase-like cupin family protein
MGSLFSMLATAADTAGAFGLIELVARQGGEPPLHTHAHEDEAFYVLDGRLTFRAGQQTLRAEPGAFVFLPRGVSHGFMFETETVRMLTLLSPGGLDRYFIETGRPAAAFSLPPLSSEPPDIEAMVRQLAAYGVRVDGPPLRALLQPADRQPAVQP